MKWTAMVLLLLSPATVLAGTERYTGTACAPDGTVLYREKHEVVENDGRLERSTTTYYDPSGREIGRLKSDYSRSTYAPDYSFADLRTGKIEAARRDGNAIVLRYGQQEKKLSISSDDTIVLGQSMHHLVRVNLDRLTRESIGVRFGIPSRLDTYGFRIRPVGAPSRGAVRLRIESDSWIIRAMAPYLEVDYEIGTKRLLRYAGVSNLEGTNGSTLNVVITYAYET